MLSGADVPRVVDVLVEAFFDYPVMRYVLGDAGPGYEGRLRTLVGFFVMARALRDETLLGVGAGESLEGAALVSRPSGVKNPAALNELRDRVWAELGEGPRSRYGAFGAAASAFAVEAPHIHLNMIGVRRRSRGSGVGRLLIDRVHELSAGDPASEGVMLTTETEANVRLYEHLGYELVGHARVAPELETWGFFRSD